MAFRIDRWYLDTAHARKDFAGILARIFGPEQCRKLCARSVKLTRQQNRPLTHTGDGKEVCAPRKTINLWCANKSFALHVLFGLFVCSRRIWSIVCVCVNVYVCGAVFIAFELFRAQPGARTHTNTQTFTGKQSPRAKELKGIPLCHSTLGQEHFG